MISACLHVSSDLQTLHKSSAQGECYVVDSEVITSGIPYQDYFYTVHRYCLTSINKNKSRLRWAGLNCMHSQILTTEEPLVSEEERHGISNREACHRMPKFHHVLSYLSHKIPVRL